jgi:hypothetical protein
MLAIAVASAAVFFLSPAAPGAQLAHGPDPAGAAVPVPFPAITTLSVRSTWGPGGATTGASIPLAAGSCAQLKPAGSLIGYVQAPSGQRASVTGTCQGPPGAAQILLTFHGLADTGTTYAGEVQIGATPVMVSVQRSAALLLPFLALILGVGLAFFILRRGPAGIIAGLRRQLDMAAAAIGPPGSPGPAVRSFRLAAGPAVWGNLDVSADAAADYQGISADLTRLSRAKWLTLSAKDPQVVALTARVTALAAVGPQLTALVTSLRSLEGGLPVVDASALVPEWTAAARHCLGPPGPITLEQLTALVADAAQSAAVAVWFPAVAQQVRSCQDRLDQLEQNQDARPGAEQQLIMTAEGLFRVALAAFGRAGTSAGLRAVYDNEFAAARRAVDGLGWIPARTFAAVAGVPDVLAPGALVSVSLPPPAELEHDAVAVIARERRASAVALAVVFVLLLLGGLEALVVGKTFGTLWDFAAAVGWGSATLAVTSPLATAIDGFQQARSLGR